MSTGNNIYKKNYDEITWSSKPDASRRQTTKHIKKHKLQIIPDIKEFQSPIDRSWITSRVQLRNHESKHNVRQVGNDWTGSTKPQGWEN
jgi:hypothetical protein